MQARFLLGPAGSGKTFRCLAEIRDALRHDPGGPPLILLAPKQATFQLERQLLADAALQGYTRLNILSFERLAQFVLEKAGVAVPESLNDEGRIMVLRAVLRHEKELRLFAGSARRPGFAQQLSRLLNELQQQQFTPARLRQLAGRGGLRDELKDKLRELALIFEKYLAWLKQGGLRDGNHLLDAATETLRAHPAAGAPPLAIAGLWLDGFAEMTPQELDLLAAVLPFCRNATLAFCLDAAGPADSSWLSIWSAVGQTVQQCRQRLETLPDCRVETEILLREPGKSRFAAGSDLALLEKNWARPAAQANDADSLSQISITACPDIEAEAVFAARTILRSVQAGDRFRDCAVLVRQLDGYHKPLARVFRRYGIPFFLDRRESVAHHPLAELTRSALRTVAYEWKNEDWFAALKAGFTSVREEAIDELENAALESGWQGKQWREPLPDEPLEKLRRHIIAPFENLAEALARANHSPDGGQLAAALRELWMDLDVEKQLEAWNQDTLPDGAPAIHLTVLDQMNGWLDNVARAFAGVPLTLQEWLPILEAGLGSLTVGVIPPALDQVLVGAIDRARNPDLKLALVLGVNESVFPAAPPPPAILTESERDELNQSVAFGPDLRVRLARERYYGYIACTRSGGKLFLTFARADAAGRTLNPSPFIAHIQRIFPRLDVAEFQGETDLAGMVHVGEIALRPEIQRTPGLLELPGLAARIQELARLREPDGRETLPPAVAEKLYGPVLRSSVSRLEEFAQCPFKFFVRAGLHAHERKLFELDARERGTFQHEVLKEFHEQLRDEGKRWRDVTPEEARRRIGGIAAKIAPGFRGGLLRASAKSQFETRALTASLQDFIEVVVLWMRRQYEFDPVAVELAFGGKPAPELAWKISLQNGRELALEGRMDRVDLWRETRSDTALAVVLDYKSGNKKLENILIENGVQLQLLAYLGALRDWKEPQAIFGVKQLIPAGAFYVSLRGKFESGATRDEVLGDADARKMAYRHTGRFAADVLRKLDRREGEAKGDQFNYSVNKDGTLSARSADALPRAGFEALLDEVAAQIARIGTRIYAGDAQVDPYRKGTQTPCEYCDYQAACRIDPWTHSYRALVSRRETANEDA